MCITFWAVEAHPKYKFVLANNRDEFLHRPTKLADIWKPYEDSESEIISPLDLEVVPPAGEDMSSQGSFPPSFVSIELQRMTGGSWIGFNPVTGRWINVLSIRENMNLPGSIKAPTPENPCSRGHLVTEFLKLQWPSMNEEFELQLLQSYLARIISYETQFRGFNVILGNVKFGISAYHTNRLSNEDAKDPQLILPKLFLRLSQHERGKVTMELCKGISNSTLSHPWPKVEKGRELLHEILSVASPDADPQAIASSLFDLLYTADTSQSIEEASLDAIRCVVTELGPKKALYGTRTSTVILVDNDDNTFYFERTLSRLDSNGNLQHEPRGLETRMFTAKVGDPIGSAKRTQ